jgi:hypothetical protein
MEDQLAAPVKVRNCWPVEVAERERRVLLLSLSPLLTRTPHSRNTQTSQTFNIVPPGPASKHRKFIAARFPAVSEARHIK